MKHVIPSLRMLLAFSVLLGLIYPGLVTLLAQWTMPYQAGGSLVTSESGTPLGSKWIAQKFADPKYFWPRPSAVDFQTMPSGASNLSPASKALKDQVLERTTKWLAAHPGKVAVPADLLFASGSGIDPEISPAAAAFQIERVAQARGLPLVLVQDLVEQTVKPPQFGFLGEARVNVLALNLGLDRLKP